MTDYPVVLIVGRGRGRDFVLPDPHGMLHLVRQFLVSVDFDPEVDRLFLVGDLVDRGPFSDEALELLNEPWCFAARGNHEDLILACYQGGRLDAAALDFHVERNGGAWWLALSEERRQAHLAAYAKMPLAIEVATARGTVGIVHAEVPIGMDWATFKAKLQAGDPRTVKSALWGRTRVKQNDHSGVAGVGRIFSGHTIVRRIGRLGNCYFLDTGAFLDMDQVEQRPMSGCELIAQTQILTGTPASNFNFFGTPDAKPFGRYADQ